MLSPPVEYHVFAIQLV